MGLESPVVVFTIYMPNKVLKDIHCALNHQPFPSHHTTNTLPIVLNPCT